MDVIASISPEKVRRVPHPFLCRLRRAKGFDVDSPQSLVGAGFASLALAIFSVFRLCPALLGFLASNVLCKFPDLNKYCLITVTVGLIWKGVLTLVLIGTGLLQLFSMKIKRQGVLLLHPWGLLFLYFDVFVWVILGAVVFLQVVKTRKIQLFTKFNYPTLYVLAYSIDCVFFFILYYVFATYFIVAELTVIEKFYGKRNRVEVEEEIEVEDESEAEAEG
ncbi:hypothetical protein RUM43_001541 [Polyplax serrata]|uniref:Uncharacterized protein n=1 Tax=Polyplax serrata TaxID=468196 RepID=A0AAN8XQW1_POLSC